MSTKKGKGWCERERKRDGKKKRVPAQSGRKLIRKEALEKRREVSSALESLAQ